MTEDNQHLLPRYRAAVRRSRKRATGRKYKLNEGRCRLCERPASVRPLTRHHLVPVEKGGTWRNENIVPLCGTCHVGVDAQGTLNRYERLQWRSMLRRRLTAGELSHIRRVMGEQWLDWNYPTIEALADRKLAMAAVGASTPRGVLLRKCYRQELGRIASQMS